MENKKSNKGIFVIKCFVFFVGLILCGLLALYLYMVAEIDRRDEATVSELPNLTFSPSVQPIKIEDDNSIALSEETQTAASRSMYWGKLKITGKTINIQDNVEEKTLKKSPGWMPQSALPGDHGMCVILGHRNSNHLRVLEKVNVGDSIFFEYTNGVSHEYIITEILIFDKTSDWYIPARDGSYISITTCYPFSYAGNAPGKYMVVGILSVY